MSRTIAIAVLAALCAFGLGLQAQSVRICCVAGNYAGFQINNAKPNCPKPMKENFTMVIKQATPCTAAIEGTVTDAAGLVNHWTGTLSPGLRGCCVLEGSFLTPSGNTVKFKGTICMVLRKWKANGTWTETPSPDPCRGSGTWSISQI